MDGSNGLNGPHLRAFIERIEKLEQDKRSIFEDVKEIYAEAKLSGFDTKMIRKVVSMRRVDKARRDEEAEMLELYLAALSDD